MGSEIISNAVPIINSNNKQQIEKRKSLTRELATISPDSDRAKEIQDELLNMSTINMADHKKLTPSSEQILKDTKLEESEVFGVGLVESIVEASKALNNPSQISDKRKFPIIDANEEIFTREVLEKFRNVAGTIAMDKPFGLQPMENSWHTMEEVKEKEYIPAEYSPNTGWDFKEDLNEKDDNK